MSLAPTPPTQPSTGSMVPRNHLPIKWRCSSVPKTVLSAQMKCESDFRPVFGTKPRKAKRSSRQAESNSSFLFTGDASDFSAGRRQTKGNTGSGPLTPARNTGGLTREERKVADLIQAYRRSKPIPLRTVVELAALNERAVQLIVEALIVTHGIRIGGSRELPHSGYYLCVDDADVEAAVRPLRSTAESLLRRIKALTRPWDE